MIFSIIILSFLACSQNMYGGNCSKSCGHCFNSEPCHNINGTCMDGCDSGYNGSKCTEGEFRVNIAKLKEILYLGLFPLF